MRTVLTVMFVMLLPSRSLAEGEPCQPQDYDSINQPRFDCPGPGELELRVDLDAPASVAVREGQEVVAPWDGALVHRHRLVEVGLSLQAVRRLRWLDRLRLGEECQVSLEHSQEVAMARLEYMEAQRDGYQEQVAAEQARTHSAQAWFRSWWFGVVVGVVSTAALVALTAYALSAVGG